MKNKEGETGGKISGSSAKVTQEKRKKKTKNNSTKPTQKTERWFTTIFYNILYYRSEESRYSPTPKYPKVKLPRGRHK
ncbi:MAG: hypothetical protein HY787_02190 [Deltaproteobacteria bacterium]|nr:hypothetical protein [Deltaproteobacteria bacterium]